MCSTIYIYAFCRRRRIECAFFNKPARASALFKSPEIYWKLKSICNGILKVIYIYLRCADVTGGRSIDIMPRGIGVLRAIQFQKSRHSAYFLPDATTHTRVSLKAYKQKLVHRTNSSRKWHQSHDGFISITLNRKVFKAANQLLFFFSLIKKCPLIYYNIYKFQEPRTVIIQEHGPYVTASQLKPQNVIDRPRL